MTGAAGSAGPRSARRWRPVGGKICRSQRRTSVADAAEASALRAWQQSFRAQNRELPGAFSAIADLPDASVTRRIKSKSACWPKRLPFRTSAQPRQPALLPHSQSQRTNCRSPARQWWVGSAALLEQRSSPERYCCAQRSIRQLRRDLTTDHRSARRMTPGGEGSIVQRVALQFALCGRTTR
jgi:hypothetical protein